MSHRALAAAVKLQEQGISVEVIDPRTLAPLDKQTIIDSVEKTGRLVIMDEDPKTGNATVGKRFSAQLSALISRGYRPYSLMVRTISR